MTTSYQGLSSGSLGLSKLKIKMLTRYWFEFDIDNAFDHPPGIGRGCGVSAFSLTDAINIMEQFVFKDSPMPPFKKVVENVDVRTLDQNHVIPNMKPPVYRGVWFPLGYD